jgi:hypothetical protein
MCVYVLRRSMFRRILPHIEGSRATGGQSPPGVSVTNVVIWRRPSFNDTKTTLKKVCEICSTNGSSMLKCSGCTCTYWCSRECQKKGWKYHKSACKNLKIDGGFDRDTLTNLKYAINLNINRSCLKTLLYVLLDVNTEKLILTLMIKMIHIWLLLNRLKNSFWMNVILYLENVQRMKIIFLSYFIMSLMDTNYILWLPFCLSQGARD